MAGPKRQHGTTPRTTLKTKPHHTDKSGLIIKRFKSISAFGDYVHTLEENNTLGRPLEYAPSKKAPEQAWDYGTDFNTALTMTRNGGAWFEGAEELAKVDLSNAPTSEYTIRPYYDLAAVGGCVDIGEYLAGSPECMQGYNDDQPTAPVIVVRYIAPVACTVTADQLFNYGRAMLALIDSLETQGYSVELTALYPCMLRGDGALAEIVVKQAGEDWNAGSIAYAMAHPAFARRIGFRFAEAFEETYNARKRSYTLDGYSEHDSETIFFGYMSIPASINTPDKAYQHVLRTAKEQRGDLFE